MDKHLIRKASWLLFGFAILSVGCGSQDTQHLARLGSKVGQKAEASLVGSNGRLLRGWQAVRVHWGEVAVDARVAARLSWDKTLGELPIKVEAEGGEVTLSGRVPDQAARRRVVEIANSTAGVDKVTDQLEVP